MSRHTDHGSTAGDDDAHTLIGPYALDALDEAEAAAVRRHLARCPSCVADVAELSATATQLCTLTGRQPPAGMRGRVLAEVARTPQDPPVDARPMLTAVPGGGPADAGAGAGRSGRRRRAGGSGLRWGLAAACLALVAAGGVYVVQEQRVDTERDRVVAERADVDRIGEVLAAPDVRMRSGTAAGARIVVAYSAQRDAAVATLVAPPPGRADRTYQLWTVSGQQPTSVGVLPPGTGQATTLIPKVSGTEVVAVTVEPVGGSPTPTLPIFVSTPIG